MSRLLPLLITTALLSPAWGEDARRPPNVLIVVVDTLRADRVGAYGNQHGLTPFFDALARRGTLFERAYAVSSWTIPSVASLFTSRYPTQHHVVTFFTRLADDEVTVAERLRDAGWIAGGVSANPNLRTDWGFAQGFDELAVDLTPHVDVPGDVVRAGALAWLDRTWKRPDRAPAVLYLQYMEPHEPYAPREPFRSRFLLDENRRPFDMDGAIREAMGRAFPLCAPDSDVALDMPDVIRKMAARGTPVTGDEIAPILEMLARMRAPLYDGDVASADDQVRQLFDELQRRGFLDDALVVLTSDHGEEFSEHGGTSHGKTLYEESVRVPLILVGPGVPAGRRIAERVSLLDLGPTLLDLLGLPAEPRFEGRSLVPLLHAGGTDQARATPEILMQLERTLTPEMDERIHSRALVHGDHKLLVRRDAGSEIYDLAADPHETRNGSPALVDQVPGMSERLSRSEATLGERAARAATPAPVDEALRQRLRALGYAP